MDKLDKLRILKSANDLRMELVNDYGLAFPFNLQEVLNVLGIIYSDEPLEKEYDGKITISSDEIKIVTNANTLYESRKRFTIAHEIGHWKLHFCDDPYRTIDCEAKNIGAFSKNLIEYEADLFASEFLLPTEIFKREAGRLLPSIRSLESLSDKYSTSLTSTAIKFVELTQEPCAVILMQDRKIKWKIHSSSFFHSIRDKIEDCYCYDMLDKGENQIRDKLYMYNWIESKSQKYIWEDVKNLYNLNQQLIILSFY